MYHGRRLLITGGCGYLASRIISLLGHRPSRIIRLDRSDASFQEIPEVPQLEDRAADVRDPSIWSALIHEVDVLFHFAAQTSVYAAADSPISDLEINVLPMLHLLETCRQQNREMAILFAGSATQSGLTVDLPVSDTHQDDPITIYDLHKCMAEGYLRHYCRMAKVKGVTLRLANVFGPGPKSSSSDRGVLNMMIRKALDGQTLTIYGSGDYIRDYVYVDDVAKAFCAASENMDAVTGNHFVIGSGIGHTVCQVVNLIADRVALKTNKRVQVIHVEPPSSLSPIELRNFVADTTRFRTSTGWRPEIPLIKGIDQTINAFLEEVRR